MSGSPRPIRDSKYRSYCATIRPLNGISDERLQLYINWAKKQLGCYCVIEEEGEARHLHLQVWLETPRARGDINIALERIFKKHDYEDKELKVLRRGTRIAYNDGFVDSYLDKGGIIVFNNKPENTSEFYPTIEEQERVQNRSHAVDPYFHDLNEEYIKWGEEENVTAFLGWDTLAIEFIAYKMFELKTMRIVKDKKQRRQLGVCLAAYHSKNRFVDFNDEDYERKKSIKKVIKASMSND